MCCPYKTPKSEKNIPGKNGARTRVPTLWCMFRVATRPGNLENLEMLGNSEELGKVIVFSGVRENFEIVQFDSPLIEKKN